jgi:hypothetical protein
MRGMTLKLAPAVVVLGSLLNLADGQQLLPPPPPISTQEQIPDQVDLPQLVPLPEREVEPLESISAPATVIAPPVHPLSDLATGIVRQTIPETFDGNDNWGDTARVLDGWRIERHGLQFKTKRRWKEVNHGTWLRYEVTPINPDTELILKIVSIKPGDGGKLLVSVTADSPIHATGRLAEWRYDIQLASFDAAATADVHVDATISLSPKIDTSEFPPAVLLVPKVETAALDISNFKLHRVSKVGGSFVSVLSGGLEKAITLGLDQKQNKIVSAINKKIEAKQDRFKVSLAEMAKSQWGDLRDFVRGAEE